MKLRPMIIFLLVLLLLAVLIFGIPSCTPEDATGTTGSADTMYSTSSSTDASQDTTSTAGQSQSTASTVGSTSSTATTAPTAGTTVSTAPTQGSTAPTQGSTAATEPVIPQPPAAESEPELLIISIEMVDEYGDATLIKLGDYEILVDAGDFDDGKNVQNVLKQYCQDGVLEMLVATHAHADHVGGFTTNFFSAAGIEEVEMIVDFGYTYTTQAYKRYDALRTNLINQGSTYYSIYDMVTSNSIPDVYYLGDGETYIEFFDTGHYVQTGKKGSGDLNDTSVAFCVNYKDTQLLMTGDLTTKCENDLIANIQKINSNYFPETNRVIYKAAHHGSNGANGNAILSFAKPDIAFISSAIVAGNRTSSGIQKSQHPYSGAVARMAAVTQEIYWNGVNGTLIFTITADGCTVEGLGRTLNYYVGGQLVSAQEEKDITYLKSAWYKAA